MAILGVEWDEIPCENCDWKPELNPKTGRRKLWPSEGGIACDWIEKRIVCGEGDWYGMPFELRKDQQEFVYEWYSYCGNCGWWRFSGAIRGEGRGGGKTQFAAALAALDLAGPEEVSPTSPNVCVAAGSFEQADICFSQLGLAFGGADGQMKAAPLNGVCNVTAKVISFRNGDPGKAFRVAAKAGTNEGGNPSLMLADETHEWGADGDNKARLFTVLSLGATKRSLKCRKGGQVVNRGPGRWIMISTAGFDVDNNMLGTWYKRCKEAQKDPTIDSRTLFDWREAEDGLDYKNPEDRAKACRQASGAADVIWSVKQRVAQWGKVPSHEWIRYFANRWVEVSEDSWLVDYPSAWNDCSDPELVAKAEAGDFEMGVVGVDMALRQDSVGVCTLRWVETPSGTRIAVTSKRFMSDQLGRIDHVNVWNYIKGQASILGTKFRGVVYDPRFFELPARLLEDEGVEVIQFDQNVARMAPACGDAFARIKASGFAHSDDYPLNSAVLTAAKREQENGTFTLSKGRSKNKIDLCIAMVMGSWVLAEVMAEPDGGFNIW
jgi:phage terminase large subunit-like protein